jgi:hypothetical protein
MARLSTLRVSRGRPIPQDRNEFPHAPTLSSAINPPRCHFIQLGILLSRPQTRPLARSLVPVPR